MMENGEVHYREFPQNVGIIAMEVYIPQTSVRQEEYETFDGVSKGKYTIGLGQTNMAFVNDREDVCSMALTVVKSLLDKYNVPYDQIGRLEVGSESNFDKSKSIKSVVMKLFQDKGYTDIEGVDAVNACYGGTAALFNSVDWIESSSWDGRYALVVATDTAIYERGPARPTGGAGAFAILLGKDAPIVIESGLRGIHMEHVYDFYKPAIMSSEYPVVDGHYSIKCYMKSLDSSYNRYKKKFQGKNKKIFNLNQIDYALFHCPFSKITQKAYARLNFLDYLESPESFPNVPEHLKQIPIEDTYSNVELEKTFVSLSSSQYTNKVVPSLLLSKELGNCYCGSLYACLLSLLCDDKAKDQLLGKRVLLFSYGSGLSAAMFSVVVNGNISHIAEKANIKERLANRKFVPPQEFTDILLQREETTKNLNWQPTGSVDYLLPGTFYISSVDKMHRRFYDIKQ